MVGKNTDLKGGLIASEAPADKNQLTTDTFSFSDLENEADYSAKSIGAAYHKYGNYDNMTKAEKDKVYNTKGLAPNISAMRAAGQRLPLQREPSTSGRIRRRISRR